MKTPSGTGPGTLSRGPKKTAVPTTAKEVSTQLEELMNRAVEIAGVTTKAEFDRFSKEERNAFLAQARGEKNTPKLTGLQNLNPRLIVRSPFNRVIDLTTPEFAEFEKDVKEKGVLQPGCVRPLPAGRFVIEEGTRNKEHGFFVTQTQLFKDVAERGSSSLVQEFYSTRAEAEAAMPKWELIWGERRYWAALRTGSEYPAIIKDVGDTEALELQAVENMQREDLNAIDEATKYEQLRERYEAEGLTKGAAIAKIVERTGMGESTVYQRLALLKLTDDLQEKVRSGTLQPSHAELVTKLESADAQKKLVAAIFAPKEIYTGGQSVKRETVSFREAKALADEAKKEEDREKAWQKDAQQYRDKGYRVMTLEQSSDIFNYGSLRSGYVAIDDACDLDPERRSWSKLLGDHAPQVIAAKGGYLGNVKLIYPRKDATKGLRKAGIEFEPLPSQELGLTAAEKNQRRQEEQAKEREITFARNSKNVEKIVTAAENREPNAEFYRLIIAGLMDACDTEYLTKRRGIEVAAGGRIDYQATQKAFEATVAKMDGKKLRGLAVEMLLWSYDGQLNEEQSAAVAKCYKVKLQTSGKGEK